MTEEVAPTGRTTQDSLGMPVGGTVDLRTASLLSGLYGVSGGIAAVLLLPRERSVNHILNFAPPICDDAGGGAACPSVRCIGSGCSRGGNAAA